MVDGFQQGKTKEEVGKSQYEKKDLGTFWNYVKL